MPSKSKAQAKLMRAVAHSPSFAKKVGIPVSVGKDFASADKKVGKYAKGGVSLSVGRGEKLPVSKGAGLTEKGRAKLNRETGSNLKAPAPNPKTKSDEGRKKSFCARMEGVVKNAKGDAPRAKASLKRWKCSGW